MYPLIHDEKKLIFFWTPKCACSSIKYYYASISGIKLPNDDEEIFIHSIVEISYVREAEKDKYENYKKLLFVRNPYSRIVSSFISFFLQYNIIENIGLDDSEWITFVSEKLELNFMNESLRQKIITFKSLPSFYNFLKILNKIDINNCDPHIAPQSKIYNYPEFDLEELDEVIDINNLQSALNELNKEYELNGIIKRINVSKKNIKDYHMVIYGNNAELDENVNIYIGKLNFIEYFRKHNVLPDWKYFYDDKEMKNIVYQMYKNDFDIFEKSKNNVFD